MKITKIHVNNYRNLDGVNVSFEEECNFIVGENNLGKSNLLSLINIVFTSRTFKYDDFKDLSIPIEIIFQIKLAEVEIGHFQDLFDISDYSLINIVAKQENLDDNINFYHLESNTYISASVVRCINYIHYDSLRNPIAEINFDKGRGVGRFLRNIISQYIETNGASETEFLNTDKISDLLIDVNNKISKIKSFEDFGISASSENDTENLLSRLVVLKDAKGDSLTKTGYGVQFLILITLSVLEKLQIIRSQRGQKGIFEDETNNTKSISLIIGLDEPEIHLHPYMQRSIIKYLNSVISNQNQNFKELVKELFDIDEFIGQIIVVTHSPNIILNNYKQIIRFYSQNGLTKIVSGNQLVLTDQLQKHLYMHFPYIKEAFFSRGAIFVEGDSEFASFPYFAQKLSIDFDDLGICILQARGDAIQQLIDLSLSFGIQSVGVTDRDDGINTSTNPSLFVTNLRDFEEEIISIIDNGKENILRAIFCQLDSAGENRVMEIQALNKRAHRKYGVVSTPYTNSLTLTNIALTDIQNLKAYYLTWYSINKSYPLGLLIGENFTASEIPLIYKQVILEAKNLVDNA